jgi:hypothetical protein
MSVAKRVLITAALLSLAGCANMTPAKRFHLSGFYVDAAMIHSNAGEGRFETQTDPASNEITLIGPGFIATTTSPFGSAKQIIFSNGAQNPYARIAIGYDVQWSPKWSTRLDYSHESSIATGQDHGAERITLGMTWRPFAR